MTRVFLIEDEGDLGRMYKRAFELRGYSVDWVTDGREALKKLQTEVSRPDALILDVMVPSMSGLDVLRAIKQSDSLRNIPVAVITNSLHKENADLFMSLGADLYLVKIENDAKDIVEKVTGLLSLPAI